MGMEDYRVVLKPKSKTSLFPEDTFAARPAQGGTAPLRKATISEIEATLEWMGFVRVALTAEMGGAHLAAPPPNEARFTSRQHFFTPTDQEENHAVEYILEALLRWHVDKGEANADSLSVRFAVCQPEPATWHFFKMLKRMCDTLPFVIAHEGRVYSSDTFWDFCLRANEQIRHQKTLWRTLFLGDMEELPMAVDDAWGYFLSRHGSLRSSESIGEKTITPTRIQSSQAVSVEDTMTPQRRKTPAPEKRNA